MENKKNVSTKPRLNVIDIIIILLVILAVVGLVVRFGNFGGASSEELESFNVYFSVSDIAYTSFESFVAGDTVTLADRDIVLGQLEGDVTYLPAKFFAEDKNGDIQILSYPESTRIDVTGHFVSQGVMTDNGYLVGGTAYIAPGTSYSVRTEHLDVTLKITDIVKD